MLQSTHTPTKEDDPRCEAKETIVEPGSESSPSWMHERRWNGAVGISESGGGDKDRMGCSDEKESINVNSRRHASTVNLPVAHPPSPACASSSSAHAHAHTHAISHAHARDPSKNCTCSSASGTPYWMRVILAKSWKADGTRHHIYYHFGINDHAALAGATLNDVDFSLKEDWVLFRGAQKCECCVVLCCVHPNLSLSAPFSSYSPILLSNHRTRSSHDLRAHRPQGQPSDLSACMCLLFIIQLIVAALIVIILDELLGKGYGLGSSINLFIMINICESICEHWARERVRKGHALPEAFRRERPQNVISLVLTAVIFAVWVQSTAGNVPDQTVLYKQYVCCDLMLATRFLRTLLVKVLGVREMLGFWLIYFHRSLTTCPLAFPRICSHPKTPSNCGPRAGSYTNPIYTSIYIVFMLSACALFSKTQIEISGSGPRDVVKQLKDQQTVMAVLEQVIPTTAAFGGAILGLLSVAVDLSGAIGSGTGNLMAVTIIYSYWHAQIGQTGMAAFGYLL
ncbi:hypothetical protein CVT25_002239 [Psilocybe cyanescens]|uniref:Translocon Sec61/SecY plug domain-containing protein n=1 Tax=Psilocybe cyanescens TaxID=93625 RepID=A0A409X5I2_PSICY|nr:hypothetical protein CVT25_002239 [Psilocybe cyanescens]